MLRRQKFLYLNLISAFPPPAVLCGRHPEEMETLVFLFSFSALGILYAMNTIPELQE